jgi:hypothetical protein
MKISIETHKDGSATVAMSEPEKRGIAKKLTLTAEQIHGALAVLQLATKGIVAKFEYEYTPSFMTKDP